VNVTSRSLAFEGFGPAVETALRSWGIDPGLIELEVSDLGSLEAEGPAKRAVEVLSAIGVRFAVDDVKTVSLAVSRIGSVPVATLKLDRSFVHLVGEDPDTAALVAAIVTLCLGHGVTCVAEGVETESQARSLVSLRCQFAQGFLFSPPLLASDIERMLASTPPQVTGEEPSQPPSPPVL
jgi:EAL domain-containing protein (putative c-di-GMP-specific phosphodiesterase class I)